MSSSPLGSVNLHFVQSFDDACEFMRWLGNRRKIMGVDTETGGFIPELNRLRLVQFGDLSDGWAIDWERWSGLALDALTRYEGPMVLHNSKFDARFISHHGRVSWDWSRTNDTMTMAHIIDPLRAKGLKPLAGMLIDPQAVAAQRLLGDAMSQHKWDWDTVPTDFPLYWIYAAMDPVLTCHLYEKFEHEVMTRYREVYDLEMGVTRCVAKMEAKGARIDRTYSQVKMDQLNAWTHRAFDWLREAYHLDNPTDLRLLRFFQDNDVPMLNKLTKSGARQAMDKEVLASIDHPVAEVILAIRKVQKQVGPYFSNFLKYADAADRIHCSIWTMGTRTARMSITEPALQTLPRRDPTVRTAFIPSDEDHALISCDKDQIEARLTAHFSGDPGLIAAFNSEDDFFCNIASQIFGRPIGKKDAERDLTKNVVYGKVYGAGVPKMALTARVPEEVMQMVNDSFNANFPGVLQMQRRINSEGRRHYPAEITTPTGRRMVADDRKEYTLMNYLIQCHAAEILKRDIIAVDNEMPDTMLLPVHDELILDVPREDAVEAKHSIERLMSDHERYRVAITSSADILLSNWGDKYR